MMLFTPNCARCTGKRGRLLLVLFTLGLGFTIPAWAQEAEIVGTVTDSSGSAIPGVSITLTNSETGLTKTVVSNDVGQYVAPSLRVGHYSVKAELTGFKTAEQKDLVLKVGDKLRVDFKLQVGDIAENVVVEANTVGVQSESGEVSEVITGQQISQLSANGRSIYSLVALSPGTSSNMPDTQVPTPVGGNAEVSFNGERMSHNLYILDGGEDLDRGGAGTFSVMPSMDAIAEFRALSSNYDAEYGLSSAGTMTMILKSGTSQYHGSAWEFNRNDAFNARNFFQADKTKDRFNVYGFNGGGPIIPSKDPHSFFFFNMEWRKRILGGSLNQIVPPTSAYGGDLGSTLIKVPTADQLSPALQQKFTAAGLALGQPFPNNTIPASLLDPNAQALLQAGIFPAPTNGNRFLGGIDQPTDVREEVVRIDHQFSSNFTIFGHWISEAISQTFGTTQWSGDNVPTMSNVFNNPSYSGVLHAINTINPTLVLETAFNYNGNRIHIIPTQQAIFQRPSNLGIPELFNGNDQNRMPSVNLSGSTGTNYTVNWIPWNNKADSYQVREDVSWTRGAHQFKFGGSFLFYAKIQDLFANTQGGFTFNGRYSGNDFADFLLGLASGYSEAAVKDAGHWNNISPALYLQDNWRASHRLTLNLGLRWDGIPHTYEANNRMSNFYPNLYDPTKKAILLPDGSIDPSSPGLGTSPQPEMAGVLLYLNGIGISGQPGIPKGMTKDHWSYFGPRVGFAYDVTGTGSTVVRGGFGVMYERIQGNDMYNGGANVPFSSNVTFDGVLLSNPSTSIVTGLPLSAPIFPADIIGISLDSYKAPVSYQYSVGVERALGRQTVLSVAYVGNQNRRQNDWREINLPDPSHLADLISGIGPKYNTLVPYLGYQSIRLAENEASSHYNSLQTSLHGQVTRDLSLQLAYTLSRAIDPGQNNSGNGYDLNNVANPYDPSMDVGRSIFDRTHVAVANFIWDLPILRNGGSTWARAIAGGWQMSGIVTAETGLPINIVMGGAQASNGVRNATNRPNVNGAVSYPKTQLEWFDTSVFSAPALGQWGNLPYNSVIGPGRQNWNLSMFKSFTFNAERGSRLEVRVETFNTFNHTQFNNPVGTFSDSRFGQITSARDPRNMQLGMKVYF